MMISVFAGPMTVWEMVADPATLFLFRFARLWKIDGQLIALGLGSLPVLPWLLYRRCLLDAPDCSWVDHASLYMRSHSACAGLLDTRLSLALSSK